LDREPLLGLFDRYLARYPDEAATVDRMRGCVQANPDCFRRELLEGHVTGSAWLLNPAGDAVLLTHHRKLDIWVQLGGHADGDPDIPRVALREAAEESGLSDIRLLSPDIFDIDIHAIPARGREPAHFHYDCRFLMQAGSERYVVTDESHDLEWIRLDDIARYTTEESVMRMVDKTRDC